MEKPYHIVRKENTEELAKFLMKNGQALLPRVELIEQSKLAVDELIDVLGRAQIEAVLSAAADRQKGSRVRRMRGGKAGRSAGTGGRKARSVSRRGSCG